MLNLHIHLPWASSRQHECGIKQNKLSESVLPSVMLGWVTTFVCTSVYLCRIYGSFSWKLVKTVTKRVKIQSVNFLMLLFGNESLTSLVYINIRHKMTVTGTWLTVHHVTSSVSVLHVTEDIRNAQIELAQWPVWLLPFFFIIQYFLINKGISVTSDIKKKNCPASLTILV